jgi:hypothetical protein
VGKLTIGDSAATEKEAARFRPLATSTETANIDTSRSGGAMVELDSNERHQVFQDAEALAKHLRPPPSMRPGDAGAYGAGAGMLFSILFSIIAGVDTQRSSVATGLVTLIGYAVVYFYYRSQWNEYYAEEQRCRQQLTAERLAQKRAASSIPASH